MLRGKVHWIFANASRLSEERKSESQVLISNNGLFRLIEPILTPLESGERRNLGDTATGFVIFVGLGLSLFLLQWD